MDRSIEADSLEHARGVVRQQHEQLLELLAQTRKVYVDHQGRLRLVERSIEETARRLERLAVERSNGTEWTVQESLLREQDQALRQQRSWLTERLGVLTTSVRRLQVVCQQTQMNLDYLAGGFGGDEEGQPLADATPLRALQAQEDERQRLAREIHDGPAQVLANAIFGLQYCQRLVDRDSVRLAVELGRLERDLRESLTDVRRFISDLRPGPLAEFGLVATLRNYLEGYQQRFGVIAEMDLDEDIARLAPNRELAIFRIIQEALQNVRKHSGASRVQVRLAREESALVVVVGDNGSGFNPAEPPAGLTRHFGLASMQERARLIRGELEIQSAPGSGTTVTLRVPLDISPPAPPLPERGCVSHPRPP